MYLNNLLIIAFPFPMLVTVICDKQTRERRPRESILCTEFQNAINSINSEISEKNHLRFLHWDLSKYSKRYTRNSVNPPPLPNKKLVLSGSACFHYFWSTNNVNFPYIFCSKTANVLSVLAKIAECALKLTGIFYCQVQPSSRRKEMFNWLPFE